MKIEKPTFKISLIFIYSLFFVFTQHLSAQSLIEHFGGWEPNYEMYTDSIPLENSDQLLIRRANIQSKSHGDAGYAAGYQSIRFEFKTPQELTTKEEHWSKGNHTSYNLEFYSDANKLLYTISYKSNWSFKYESNQLRIYTPPTFDFYYYSIDFQEVPLMVLSQAKRVNIYKFIE